MWLETVFDAETKEKAAGETRVLILDGHSSHYTLEFIQYARENNIIILGYPPHCTHALQGLDVVCFGKMKVCWRSVIEEFEKQNQRDVTKSDFTHLFGKAYLQAFDEKTVKAAFSVTGVYPFNRSIITEEQMKPSVPHSIKGAFPLPQASPIRAIMAAFHSNPPTAFDLSPSNHIAAPMHTNSRPVTPNASGSIPMRPTTPESPTRRRIPGQLGAVARDPCIDPMLYTPSKRMRSLYAGLSLTSSGSFLVSKAKITSSTPILHPVLEAPPTLPDPDWDLLNGGSIDKAWVTTKEVQKENQVLRESLVTAHLHIKSRDMMLEGAHAQLTYQNLHLEKMNYALKNKEERTKNDRALLFDGTAQVLSSTEFENKIKEQKKKAADKEKQKEENAEKRCAARRKRDELEARWDQIKVNHEARLAEWTEECRKLADQGVPKRDWPGKPKRQLKSTLIEQDSPEDDDDGTDNGSNGGEEAE